MYFKIKTIESKPYLQFDLLASNLIELEKLGLTRSSPFVIESSVMEALTVQHGIYIKMLNENGLLIDRPQSEIDQAELEAKLETKNGLRLQMLQMNSEIALAIKLSEDITNLENEFIGLKSQYDAIEI